MIEFKFVGSDLHVLDDGFVTRVLKPKQAGKSVSYGWRGIGRGKYIVNQLGGMSAEQFPNGLGIGDLYKSESFSFVNFVVLSKQQEKLVARCHIAVSYSNWESPLNLKEVFKLLMEKIVCLGYKCELLDEPSYTLIDVLVPINDCIIVDAIEKFALKAKHEYLVIEQRLLKSKSAHLLVKLFNFPQQYEVICSQYLLWFGELLKSLGIDASVSTENKNGQTFLSIEPKDNTALTSEIEKALYLYLSLPYSEYLPAETTKDNLIAKVEFQQLQHQVQMFQQQIEVKNSLLEMKSVTNEALKKDLEAAKDKVLLLESLKDNKLELLGGALALDEYKIGPVTISPKKVAKLFGKKNS